MFYKMFFKDGLFWKMLKAEKYILVLLTYGLWVTAIINFPRTELPTSEKCSLLPLKSL